MKLNSILVSMTSKLPGKRFSSPNRGTLWFPPETEEHYFTLYTFPTFFLKKHCPPKFPNKIVHKVLPLSWPTQFFQPICPPNFPPIFSNRFPPIFSMQFLHLTLSLIFLLSFSTQFVHQMVQVFCPPNFFYHIFDIVFFTTFFIRF